MSPAAGSGVTGELDLRRDRPAAQKLGLLEEDLVGALLVRVRRGLANGLKVSGLDRPVGFGASEALRGRILPTPPSASTPASALAPPSAPALPPSS